MDEAVCARRCGGLAPALCRQLPSFEHMSKSPPALGMPPTLHHIGCVVDSIDARIAGYRVALGAVAVTPTVEDPIQRVRVAFLTLPTEGALQFELVEPATADSPVRAALAKGGGLHHVCYQVDELEVQIAALTSARGMLIRRPQPAVAFGGRRIAWMRTHEGLLIEYLERGLVAPIVADNGSDHGPI